MIHKYNHKYNHTQVPLCKRADKAPSCSMYAGESTQVAFALLPLGIAYARERRLRKEEG